MSWVNFLLVGLAAALLMPVGVLCAECLAALLPSRRLRNAAGQTHQHLRPSTGPRIAVLIPAHNEEAVIADTLSSIVPQLREGDRVVVVADNCDDDTAAIARRFEGVSVLERFDTLNRGKGFALDHGIRHLQADAPGVLVMADADCTVHSGAIDALIAQVAATGRPAQACYLMERPENPGPKDCVSALAFLVKNWVRPSGLYQFGLPCLLTGTGMAFPWQVIAKAKLASDNIVEDMQLGLDLALDGHAPLFCGGAHVTGHLPKQQKIAYGQRTRWEHGHLQTLLTQVPRMFKAGVRHRRVQAISLAMELSVPPLALLMMALIALTTASTAAGLVGASWLPAKLLAGGLFAIGACLLGAWAKFGRQSLPFTALLAAPVYVVWKVPMYFAFLFKRHTEWNRTARVAFEIPPGGTHAIRDLNLDIPVPAAKPAAAPAFSPFDPRVVTAAQCVQSIFRELAVGRGGMVVRPTADHVYWIARDP